jgi:hypothetical protein
MKLLLVVIALISLLVAAVHFRLHMVFDLLPRHSQDCSDRRNDVCDLSTYVQNDLFLG